MRRVEVETQYRLADYEAVAHLAGAVRDLEEELAGIARQIRGRTVWMVNSTERGGGVAEMLPTMVSLMRELGIATEWVVIETQEPAFFDLTKRLHNMIHGVGPTSLSPADRAIFEQVNQKNADVFARWVHPGDIVVVHDPQPMPLGGMISKAKDITAIWRCHIGLDEHTPQTRAAWEFLAPYGVAYKSAVFSAPEYIPDFFAGRSRLIYPGINPLTSKNRDLHLHKIVGILSNASLAQLSSPVVPPPFARRAQRLQGDGTFLSAATGEDIGLLSRPIVTQISRWDRLKGFLPLMQAFARLKLQLARPHGDMSPVHRRRLKLARLVLAGPDPSSIADDPEGKQVLAELCTAYQNLDPAVQDDVALLALPMTSTEENALMVNAIQRSSSIVVQNSLREGFGLTVTEAMWKRIPVLTNTRACGTRQQIRDGLDGKTIENPEDVDALAQAIDNMLSEAEARPQWGQNAQRRVHERFLIFSQLSAWASLFRETINQ